jgi:hypothetical protein
MYVHCAQHDCNTQCVAVRTHLYRLPQYNLLCTFSVHNITVTHNVLLSEHTGTDRLSTICYVRYTTQLYSNIQCVAARTHRYRPSQYNLLCTFTVHNITVTHNVLLSEHTGTDRHSTIFYVRSLCTRLLYHNVFLSDHIVTGVTVQFVV